MRGIFDQHEMVKVRNPLERIHVGRLPGEVHRNDGARAGRDRGLDRAGIEVEGIEVDVREHRNRIRFHHRGRGGQKRVRRHDDLVFGLNAGREQRDSERHRAIGHRDAVPAAVHRSEALLELAHLRTIQAAPLPAAQGLEQTIFLGPAEDGPGGERTSADGRIRRKKRANLISRVRS